MEKMKSLVAQREAMEKEIKELTDLLDSQKGVGMSEPLVDAEQYPRADIDVYSVRHARNRIICLQNDHKALMGEIEQVLYQIHAEAREKKQQGEAMEVDALPQTAKIMARPFATVDRVDTGSPAEASGLEVGDRLVQFGSITSVNFTDLKCVGQVVQHSKDRPLSVTVLRNDEEIHLGLTPKAWSGRGLLGCNIVPVKR